MEYAKQREIDKLTKDSVKHMPLRDRICMRLSGEYQSIRNSVEYSMRNKVYHIDSNQWIEKQ